MTSEKFKDQTIALAGLCQAVTLVHRLATSGYLERPEFLTCMKSLLEQNPRTTLDTYGPIQNLECGLQAVVNTIGSIKSDQQNIFRYFVSVLHLQAKLKKQPDILDVIGSRLTQINQQAQHFDPAHDNVVANLADLYSDTISRFHFRIQVRGDANYLQQDRVACQVRSLLFSAIRSATLWDQLGGKRWHLLVYRKQILNHARQLLIEAKSIEYT